MKIKKIAKHVWKRVFAARIKSELKNFAEWLYYRNLNDDTMTPSDWVNVYLNNKHFN